MSQLFSRTASHIFNVVVVLACVAPLVIGFIGWKAYPSAWWSGRNEPLQQTVPFSHQHHAGVLGIDCRYCHQSVERSAFAGIPPIKTCMTCHSQIWTTAAMLEPIRQSYSSGVAIQWRRVHDLPEFVFFDHSIHVAKGVGCSTCHGRVDQMPLTLQHATLEMRWCVDCHRDPSPYLRPKSEVFDMAWTPPANQREAGRALMRAYHINTAEIMDCVACHR